MPHPKKPINEINIFSSLSNTAKQIISELLEHNEKLRRENQQLRDRLKESGQKHFISEDKPELKLTNHQRNISHLYSQFQYKLKSPKFKHWSTLIGKFLVSQGSIQFFNLLTGFFLLRWMTVENYAQFSVAFGIQTTFNMLIDTGFSASIIALVGDRFQDKSVVGKYIKSAQQFRNRSFAVIIPIAGIVFHLICTKHNWSWVEQILLFGAITASLFFQGWASYYAPALLMHQQIVEYYKPQIVGSAVRLFFCYILYIISALSAWTNIWITTLTIAFSGISYRYSAANFIDKPEKNDPAVSKEMVAYISPLIPGLIFTAFQGQISLAVISIMGQTQNIAEVSALGRLGQLFVLLGAFNGIVIEPYIAKVNRSDLPKRYFQILGISIFIASMICVMSFVFPQPLLWLLGSKYQNLGTEVGWVVAGACLSYVGGVMWTMHSARKWIYWWGTFAYIGIILITQVGCLINQMPSDWLAKYSDSRIRLTGSVPHSTLNEYYSSASVFVFPSLVEGFGLVLLEAMACGIPIITTPNTAGPDIITDGIEGFIVPIRDIEALKQKLEWCYSHPQELAEMGIAARRKAEQLTWANYRQKLATVIKEKIG